MLIVSPKIRTNVVDTNDDRGVVWHFDEVETGENARVRARRPSRIDRSRKDLISIERHGQVSTHGDGQFHARPYTRRKRLPQGNTRDRRLGLQKGVSRSHNKSQDALVRKAIAKHDTGDTGSRVALHFLRLNHQLKRSRGCGLFEDLGHVGVIRPITLRGPAGEQHLGGTWRRPVIEEREFAARGREAVRP